MNTRKLRKAILTLCSALLLVSLSVGITVAYLTSTDTVVNTFTTGKVQIKLDEAVKVEEEINGVKTGNWIEKEETVTDTETGETTTNYPRTKENDYKLYPGCDYAKDPTVTVLKGSEDSYVRVLITLKNAHQLDELFAAHPDLEISDLIAEYDKDKWLYETNTEVIYGYEEVTDEDGNVTQKPLTNRTYELRYYQKVTAEEVKDGDLALKDVFTKITVPESMTGEDMALLNNVEITIVAQAMQAEGFADADAAWTAWQN